MGGFECLNRESYRKIRELNRRKVIPDTLYKEMEDTQSFRQLLKVLQDHFTLSPTAIPPTWLKIINQMWQWDRRDPDNRTVFNEFQSIFVKELLNRGGIYLREECQKEILTDAQISKHITNLEKQNLILSLRTRPHHGNKTIFILIR